MISGYLDNRHRVSGVGVAAILQRRIQWLPARVTAVQGMNETTTMKPLKEQPHHERLLEGDDKYIGRWRVSLWDFAAHLS